MTAPQLSTGMKIWAYLGVALGALSFLVLLGGNWTWAGIGCAVGALVIGTAGKRSPIRRKAVLSLVAIGLAIAGALCFIVLAYGQGLRVPHTL